MKNMIMVKVAVIIFTVILIPAAVFSQEEQPAAPVQMTGSITEVALSQSDDVSIYGEVMSVDLGSNIIKVQYYDYDSDEEKTIDIVIDANTMVENGLSVNDIASGDWVDVIYTVKAPKNIAKSIIVEKEEEMMASEETTVQVEE